MACISSGPVAERNIIHKMPAHIDVRTNTISCFAWNTVRYGMYLVLREGVLLFVEKLVELGLQLLCHVRYCALDDALEGLLQSGVLGGHLPKAIRATSQISPE